MARIARDALVGCLDGIALTFEYLRKIVIGGEQSAGHLGLFIVAARIEQNVGDLSPLVGVVGQQRSTDVNKPDKAHGATWSERVVADDHAAAASPAG